MRSELLEMQRPSLHVCYASTLRVCTSIVHETGAIVPHPAIHSVTQIQLAHGLHLAALPQAMSPDHLIWASQGGLKALHVIASPSRTS